MNVIALDRRARPRGARVRRARSRARRTGPLGRGRRDRRRAAARAPPGGVRRHGGGGVLPRRRPDGAVHDGLAHAPRDGAARDRARGGRAARDAGLPAVGVRPPAAAARARGHERAPRGASPALYTVLVEGDDLNDPIADAVAGAPRRAHRALARAGERQSLPRHRRAREREPAHGRSPDARGVRGGRGPARSPRDVSRRPRPRRRRRLRGGQRPAHRSRARRPRCGERVPPPGAPGAERPRRDAGPAARALSLGRRGAGARAGPELAVMAFQFRLDVVLRHRRHREDAAVLGLARAESRLAGPPDEAGRARGGDARLPRCARRRRRARRLRRPAGRAGPKPRGALRAIGALRRRERGPAGARRRGARRPRRGHARPPRPRAPARVGARRGRAPTRGARAAPGR